MNLKSLFTFTILTALIALNSAAQNLITNGDFSAGNTAFSSGYTFIGSPTNSATPGTYGIRNTSLSFNPGYNSFGDHTTGSGLMMLVDGYASGTTVWSQTVNVISNATYVFSGYAISAGGNPATLQFLVNGVQAGANFNLPAVTVPSTPVWNSFSVGWNSTSNSTATLAIVDANPNWSSPGDDFGLDDLSFVGPPANDLCANPISLTSEVPYSQDISLATELGEPAAVPCGTQLGHGVWFTVTPTNNERVVISTAGSTFPTALTVYTNACGSLSNAVDYYGTVLCSGNYNYNGAAAVNFSSVSNVVYHILVGGAGGGNAGMLQITATFTNPPANDLCANPISLTSGIPYSQDISLATELGEPAAVPCGTQLGHGVWFTVTPTNNERVVISTAGSTFPTALTVYTNACGSLSNAVDYYGTVLCSGNYNYNGAAAVNFSSVSNVVYHILVGGAGGGNAGMLQITATFTNPPANDLCANPISLTSGVPYSQDISLATELGEPASLPCGTQLGHGVWFTVTPTNNERVVISTAGSTFPTALTVYTNACGSLNNAVDYYGTVLCSGNYNYNGAAAVNFSSVSNVVYHILVGGAGGGNAGMLQITATFTNPPANDLCANPISLTSGVPYSQDISLATELGEPAAVPCGTQLGHGVWFTVTPTNNER